MWIKEIILNFRLLVRIRGEKVDSRNSITGCHLYLQWNCAKGKADRRSCLGTLGFWPCHKKQVLTHTWNMCGIFLERQPQELVYFDSEFSTPTCSHWSFTLKMTQTFIPKEMCLPAMVVHGSSCMSLDRLLLSNQKPHKRKGINKWERNGLGWGVNLFYSIPWFGLVGQRLPDKGPKH